ncbi:MAG: GPP34 family phosphoprotein [Calditrichaeota bacterium]|nr:MAG: GPP34 family phosphoprotein [Calditrichota bacterium]
MQKLFFYEEIMLLALRDKEGTIASGAMYTFALSGAIVAELLLQERVKIDETRRNKLLDVIDDKPLGDPLLDECLLKIKNARRRASLSTWVSRFSGIKKLKHRVAQHLCQRGILRMDEDQILFIFTRKIYPELNPIPEREIKERIEHAIFTETNDIDSRTVVLISLAKSTNLLHANFDKKQLKKQKKRIKQITEGEMTGKAAAEAIAAMQAAVMAATMVPIMAAATVSN